MLEGVTALDNGFVLNVVLTLVSSGVCDWTLIVLFLNQFTPKIPESSYNNNGLHVVASGDSYIAETCESSCDHVMDIERFEEMDSNLSFSLLIREIPAIIKCFDGL